MLFRSRLPAAGQILPSYGNGIDVFGGVWDTKRRRIPQKQKQSCGEDYCLGNGGSICLNYNTELFCVFCTGICYVSVEEMKLQVG